MDAALSRGSESRGHGRAGCARPGMVFASWRTDQKKKMAMRRLCPERESIYQAVAPSVPMRTARQGAPNRILRRQRIQARALSVCCASFDEGRFAPLLSIEARI